MNISNFLLLSSILISRGMQYINILFQFLLLKYILVFFCPVLRVYFYRVSKKLMLKALNSMYLKHIDSNLATVSDTQDNI